MIRSDCEGLPKLTAELIGEETPVSPGVRVSARNNRQSGCRDSRYPYLARQMLRVETRTPGETDVHSLFCSAGEHRKSPQIRLDLFCDMKPETEYSDTVFTQVQAIVRWIPTSCMSDLELCGWIVQWRYAGYPGGE